MEPVAVPAGEGDLAVAAKFALESIDGPGAKSSAAAELDGDRSDSSSAGSSSSEDDDDDGSDDDDGEMVRPSTEGAEYEFSDGEDADGANRVKPPNYPAIIRDGDDSSEWSDSSDEEVEELDMANMPRWLEDIKNGVDRDLDDDACHAEPPRTKNEIPAEQRPAPPPPPPIGADEAIVPIGDVISVVGDTVVVQSLPNTPPLDEESVLCLDTRLGLGAVEEVFGPVASPLYALRVPKSRGGGSAEGGGVAEGAAEGAAEGTAEGAEVAIASDVKVGARVYVVEGRSRVIETKGLYTKGYDNSGQNDEEVDDDEDYSDDEKEAEAKKKRKQKKRGADGVGKGGGAVRDGGLAAAAAAAGGTGTGVGTHQHRHRFQPKVPPAAQLAHMGIGGPHQQHQHQPGFAPQQPPMMMQTPAGMVPVMPVGQPGGYVQTPRGLVQMVPTMVHPPQPPRAPGQSYYQAPGQSYYQAPGQTNPPPPPQ